MQLNTRKLKKLIIKAVPYAVFSYVGNLIGFAYRTAEGEGFQEKNPAFHEQSRCGICTNLSQFTPVGYFIRVGTGGCHETCSLYQIEKQKEVPPG